MLNLAKPLLGPGLVGVGGTLAVHAGFSLFKPEAVKTATEEALRTHAWCTPLLTREPHDNLLFPLQDVYTMLSLCEDQRAGEAAFADMCAALDDMIHDRNVLFALPAAHVDRIDPAMFWSHKNRVWRCAEVFLQACDAPRLHPEEGMEERLASMPLQEAEMYMLPLPVDTTWRQALLDVLQFVSQQVMLADQVIGDKLEESVGQLS